jgi:glutathione S-transferase
MQIRKLKLCHPPNVRSARATWLLHELVDDGFDLETTASPDAGRHSDLVLDANPDAPVLEIVTEDGASTRMNVSGAMVVLLADAFPERGLAPPPGPFSHGRADYLQMIHFCGTTIDMMLWQIRIEETVLADGGSDDWAGGRYRRTFSGAVEPQLMWRLEDGGYACGRRFSAADCMLGHGVLSARAQGLCTAPAFTEYVDRLSQRQAFASAFAGLADVQMRRDAPVVEPFTA